MNLVEKAKTLIDKVSDQTQSPDVKKVLQDTKNSLESLKKSVDEKNITQPNQESSMNYLKDCIAKIADVQWLSAEEKKIMNDLKIQIEAKSTLETIKIIDIITIVSALEQKSEQLSAVDQEKIKELHQINGLHKTMLDNLKGAIVKTQDKLQEKKIEYITKVKEDLEKHRRSSRLAKPAYEYLMDKHVHKKPIGKFREWLMGSVGIALVWWFVGKDLKDMISNIETIKLDDITDIEKKAEEKLAQANKWYEDVITSIGPIVKGSIEKFSGKKLDESKFKPVFDKRTKDWMMETNIMGDKLEENIKKIRSKQGEVDIFWYTIAFLGLPARAWFDLMIQLACAWVIPRTDIMINTAEQTGKGILKFGLWSIGLFANTIKRTFGNISTEELAEYADIAVRQVQYLESKNPSPAKIDTIEKLAKALRLSCSGLLDF